MSYIEDFSYDRLRALYSQSVKLGYRSLFFGDESNHLDGFILWRHDIDIELAAAVRMAELETQEGIQSTYFFMVRSWFYNLMSWEGSRAIRRLLELGHQIGLHCDLNVKRDAELSPAEVEKRVAQDFSLLDKAYPGAFSKIVSFHNPPNIVLGRSFAKFYSTYQSKFFSHIKYLSDSNRHWREGPPEAWLDSKRNSRYSILLHPVIWAYPGETMPAAMCSYLNHHSAATRQMLIADDVEV